METIIIILLIILSGLSVTLYVLQYKEIKSIKLQLEKIKESKSNSMIKLSTSNKAAQGLVLEVNKTLKGQQKIEEEYKRMESELKQAIANMSHDLRTPLTSIMGYIQLIDDEHMTYQEKKEYIDIVKRRAESLQTLIASFYDLSRLESKEYAFEIKSLRLDNIIYDLIASYYREFTEKGIEPKIDVDEKSKAVIADENAVKRIFSNLIQNAIKYAEGPIEILLKEQDGYILTTFTNIETNLSQGDVKRIFDRFFTGDRTRSGKSTGLGLAITKELVEQMGHQISAEKENNKLSIIIKWKLSSLG